MNTSPIPSAQQEAPSAASPAYCLKAHDSMELYAYSCYSLGFHIKQSLVAIGVRADASLGVLARMDIKDCATAEHIHTCAAGLRRDGSQGCVLLLQVDLEGWDKEDALRTECAALVSRVTAVMSEHGVQVHQVHVVGEHASFSVAEPVHSQPGLALEMMHADRIPTMPVEETSMAKHFTHLGRSLRKQRPGQIELPHSTPSQRTHVLGSARQLQARTEYGGRGQSRPTMNAWRTLLRWITTAESMRGDLVMHAEGGDIPEGPCTITELAVATQLSEAEVAQIIGELCAGLADRHVRDTVLAAIVSGLPLRLPLPNATPKDCEKIFESTHTAWRRAYEDATWRPSGHMLPGGKFYEALLLCASGARGSLQVGPLSLLAMLCFYRGKFVEAGLYADAVLSIEHDHSLMGYLMQMLVKGMSPAHLRSPGNMNA